MRRKAAVLVIVTGAIVGFAASAAAHNTPYAWTAARSQVELQGSAVVALPAADREALDAELDALLAKFRLLLLQAQEQSGDWLLAATYDNYIKRFQKAQDTVNKGLSIDSVKCVGQGRPLKGKRYKHFQCSAKSYVLEIPNVELRYGAEGALPEVVEGPVRRIGPLQATFTVHVMGKSRMLSQRAS